MISSRSGREREKKNKIPFTTHFCRCGFYNESKKRKKANPHPQDHIAELERGEKQEKGFFHFTKIMEKLIVLNIIN